MAGILYVVFNESIRNPETNERLYKIGITKKTVSVRYLNLGLKMPGKFETLFAYKFENYKKAEQIIHGIFSRYRENGEWFNLNQKQLDLLNANCEEMGGILMTDEFEKGMESEIENKHEKKDKTYEGKSSNPLNIPNLTDTVDIKILEGILKRGVLHVNDDICFHTTVDVLNSIFGKSLKQGFAAFGKCAFRTKQEDKWVWFPPLDVKKGPKNIKWTNTMPDEFHIHQIRIDGSPQTKDDNPKPCAIFAKKIKDEYRFVGIFLTEKYENNHSIRISKRISTELHLQDWDIKIK